MKLIAIMALVALVVPAFAYAEEDELKYENFRINLDWDKKATLRDSIVQVCDDSYYQEVELHIPGKTGKDFLISAEADIGNVKPNIGCDVRKAENGDKTIFFFDAQGKGGCTIRVEELPKDSRAKPKSAEYSVSDAC